MLRYIHIEMKCWAWNSLILSFHWLLTHPMLTDAWQIPPGSLLLSVVYPLAQITVLPPSLSPISVVLPPLPLSHQCGFASRSPTMDPWHGQANAASCRTLPEAAPFLSFMPFLLWLSLFEFFFPEKPSLKSLAHETSSLGLLRGNTDWISFTLQIFRKKNTKHEKRSSPFAWKQYHRQVKTNWKNTFGTCDKTLISLIYKSSWKWKVTQSCATLCDPMD